MSPSADDLGKPADVLLLTCEHGGNEVPPAYAHLFHGARPTLATHRGYDIGALGVAHRIAAQLAAPILFSITTRLLIDLNRSLDSTSLFSEYTRGLSESDRDALIHTIYEPYRRHATRMLTAAIQTGHRVVHVGIHSFTDVFNHMPRELDLALLFDESRPAESAFCQQWQQAMLAENPRLRYRFNEPYRGSDDGLTTTLRQSFPPDRYLGLEVEIRQGLIQESSAQIQIGNLLANTLGRVIDAAAR